MLASFSEVSILYDQVLFLSLFGFAAVAILTPGYNNLMVVASASAFGIRKTIQHVFGIAVGLSVMFGAVSIGLGALIVEHPQLLSMLKLAGVAWMIWFAWKLVRPLLGRMHSTQFGGECTSRPLRFLEAAAFQWINPKSWAMVISVNAAYSSIDMNPVPKAIFLAALFFLVSFVSNGLWLIAGGAVRTFIGEGSSHKWPIVSMAIVVILSAIAVLLG